MHLVSVCLYLSNYSTLVIIYECYLQAKDAEADGNHERAEQAVLTAVQVNLCAIVFYILSFVIVVLVLIVHFSLVDDNIPS